VKADMQVERVTSKIKQYHSEVLDLTGENDT